MRLQYQFYRGSWLSSVNSLKLQKHAVTVKELIIAPPWGVPRGTDSYSFQYSASSELLNTSLWVKLERCFAVIGFNAANVMRHCTVQGSHKLRQRFTKLEKKSQNDVVILASNIIFVHRILLQITKLLNRHLHKIISNQFLSFYWPTANHVTYK